MQVLPFAPNIENNLVNVVQLVEHQSYRNVAIAQHTQFCFLHVYNNLKSQFLEKKAMAVVSIEPVFKQALKELLRNYNGPKVAFG